MTEKGPSRLRGPARSACHGVSAEPRRDDPGVAHPLTEGVRRRVSSRAQPRACAPSPAHPSLSVVDETRATPVVGVADGDTRHPACGLLQFRAHRVQEIHHGALRPPVAPPDDRFHAWVIDVRTGPPQDGALISVDRTAPRSILIAYRLQLRFMCRKVGLVKAPVVLGIEPPCDKTGPGLSGALQKPPARRGRRRPAPAQGSVLPADRLPGLLASLHTT